MNNPVRAFVQNHYEAKILRKMTSSKRFNSVLEIGCGRGIGAQIIKKFFSPEKIFAIDLDEKMIRIARKRNHDSTITFDIQDAANLNFPDNYFDAIFDFGMIHHIPAWKNCLSEIKRVLTKNGELILEDLSFETFETIPGKLFKALSVHPYETMYRVEEFKEYLKEIGFKILAFKESYPLHILKFFSLCAVKKEIGKEQSRRV